MVGRGSNTGVSPGQLRNPQGWRMTRTTENHTYGEQRSPSHGAGVLLAVLLLICFFMSAGSAEETIPALINGTDQVNGTPDAGAGEHLTAETGNETAATSEGINETEPSPDAGFPGTGESLNPTELDMGSPFTGTETLLSTATWETDEQNPAIWEDRIAWASSGPSPEDPEMYDSVIFLSNSTTGTITRIDSSWPWATHPDIWGDSLVWQEYDPEEYDLEIALYTISTGEKILLTDDSLNQLYPEVWGDLIVWQEGDETIDSDFGVYLYDIRTGITTKLSENTPFALHPAIWEDRVVWEDGRNGNDLDIFLYNVTDGSELQVTSDPGFQMRPSVWGDRIVWEDQRAIPQIFMYDISAGNETQITEGDFFHQNPRISGTFVVYENEMTYYDVSLLDTLTLRDEIVSQDTTGAAQMEPDIWGNRIVWTDGRNGNYDIYLSTLGESWEPLHADFTQNATQGRAPLVVSFTDTSSGKAEGWFWDFGDGTSSTLRNPVHTYETGGSYTVILTVHNPRQRDAIRNIDLISVAVEPVPRFSGDILSGPAPLAVQFTDESSGTPVAWYWNFGDGETAEQQNPLHTFSQPGVYDVELTVANIFGNASLTKQEMITVMDGTFSTCVLPSEGIRVQDTGQLILNTTQAGTCSFDPEEGPSILLCSPDEQSGIALIMFHASDGSEFSPAGNDTITGTIEKVVISSCDLAPRNFSQETGNQCFVNFTLAMDHYEPGGVIHTVAWEGSTPEDLITFRDAAMWYNTILDHIAYCVRFEEDTRSPGPATLIFGISPDWIEKFGWRWCEQIESEPSGAAVFVDSRYIGDTPLCIQEGLSPGNHTVTVREVGYSDKTFPISIDDKRDSIHVIRIGDDGTGEVLNTTFIGHDPIRNVDLFKAESPHGISTFGLASLSKSGNIPQLVNLVISGAAHASGGGGGGGWGSSASTSLGSVQETTAPTPVAQEPAETLSPSPEERTAPEITLQSVDTAAPEEPALPVTSEEQGVSPIGSLVEGTSSLIILRNLSVVFVVIFVSLVFYLRWKR